MEARLRQGGLDEILRKLYGAPHLERARTRCAGVLEGFAGAFGGEAQALFSAPGRTELGGNHTDHQHGQVLAAGVDLDILAAVAPNESGVIRVQSEGYPLVTVDMAELSPRPSEENTTAALVRGVAARMAELGCPLKGAGLDAYMKSSVPGGSGLSSSAAFEVLVGTILNSLFWEDRCSAVEIAQIGQYAENVFFGKPCGLMDQTASSVGGVVAIDFADTAHPKVEQIALDLAASGYAMCILDSGADHADLSDEYSAIPMEMREVAAELGAEVLRDADENTFREKLAEIRQKTGDRAVVRAFHFFRDSKRAVEEAELLQKGEFRKFLRLVRESGQSSVMYLQNVRVEGRLRQQEVLYTLAACDMLLGESGAFRVHGGGFAGTVQAFVPNDLLPGFIRGTEAVLGQGACHVLSIRPQGGVQL